MAKYNYNYRLPGALRLHVESPLGLLDSVAAQLLLAAYLPGVEILRENVIDSGKPHSITIRLIKSANCSLSTCGGTYTLSAPFSNEEAALMDLLFLMYGVARQYWLTRGLYAVHAACLENHTGSLQLLVGHSGAGKTAATLSLVGRGHKVYSGNKTLVKIADGKISVVAGTHTITTKAEDLERHLPQHRPAEGYQGRSAFTLPSQCYSNAAGEVSKIALPRLNDAVQKCHKLGAVSAVHKLYPYFLDTVNADIVLLGGQAVFCGAPSRKIKERLSADLSSALSQIPVVELEGSIGYVTEKLEEL